MQQITLDFQTAQTPAEIHGILSRGLHFPPYYGSNLDALWDCLSDLSFSEDQTEITALLPKEQACPPYLRIVLSVLLEASGTFSLPVGNKEEIWEFLREENFPAER